MAGTIVEVEKAECQHLHSWNYDPTKVVIGQPVQVLPDGRYLCMDCGELFQPQVPERRYTLAQFEQLAHEFIGDPNVDNYERRLFLSIFITWLAKREREVGDGAGSGK